MKKVILCVVLMLAACGQDSPPSVIDIKTNVEYFELQRPDGSHMWCVKYGSGTSFTQQSKSWFSFTCDWGNQYPNPK